MNDDNNPTSDAADEPANLVVDCEPAQWTDPECATCRGKGKVGPYALHGQDGGSGYRKCPACSIPPAYVTRDPR